MSFKKNRRVQVEGTPLHGVEKLDSHDFVRTIAVARVLFDELGINTADTTTQDLDTVATA